MQTKNSRSFLVVIISRTQERSFLQGQRRLISVAAFVFSQTSVSLENLNDLYCESGTENAWHYINVYLARASWDSANLLHHTCAFAASVITNITSLSQQHALRTPSLSFMVL